MTNMRSRRSGGRPFSAVAHGDVMLSVYYPAGASLERIAVEPGECRRRRRGVDRSDHADRAGRQAGRAAARHRGADARGNAGDRGLQPALCRERRALHDRDADVPVGHRDAEDHGGHLHSVRPSAGHRALRRTAAVRHRRAQAGARLLAQGVGRNGADGPARRGDRPLRRHSGAHRRRGRPGLAFDLRAGRPRPGRRPTTTCSRRSAARAI